MFAKQLIMNKQIIQHASNAIIIVLVKLALPGIILIVYLAMLQNIEVKHLLQDNVFVMKVTIISIIKRIVEVFLISVTILSSLSFNMQNL